LVGEWTGSGQLGGHFGIAEREFETRTRWKANGSQLDYEAELAVGGKVFIQETGVWKVGKERPKTLVDESTFPLDVQITVSTASSVSEEKTGDNSSGAKQAVTPMGERDELKPSWSVQYVGLVGKGRIELLSDKIKLLNPLQNLGDYLVNDLYRSKRMFGMVNNRVLWAWDIALIGAVGAEEGLSSIAAGGMWK
jgi:hypothetical protein